MATIRRVPPFRARRRKPRNTSEYRAQGDSTGTTDSISDLASQYGRVIGELPHGRLLTFVRTLLTFFRL